MTPARWQQVKETLASALEHETTSARAQFLEQACAGDTSLRREVEALLNHSPDAFQSWADKGGFLRSDSSATNAGRRIGAYQLVRELGRGGMGAVWLATRADEEFQQTAAIKLLKRGTDTDEVLRRFRGEREILARLQHPNIARLLDGGTTDDGLPYFIMEYVEGVPLTSYVVERHLSLGARLQLVSKICGAVQFAHQNLIVHRDLKPANILVTPEGEPKLLDFGIAKLLATDAQAWEATIAGHERLTPGYASPEQVLGEPITTVSDVYSLGALLYETLCERPPHSFQGERPSPTELLRVICQEEPARPSLAAATPEMRRAIRGDLETIIRRAMSKDPARRYSGAGQLADDLRRYEEGWPVRARRDTVGYRLGKFARRNKLGVAIAVLVVASSIATALLARKAEHERALANERFNQVRQLAHSVLFDYHDQIAALPGSTQVRERLVKDALAYLDRLSRDAATDKSLLQELAIAYEKVGRIQGNAYYDNLGDTTGALTSYRKSLAICQQLHAGNPKDRDITFALVMSHEGIGDILNTIEDLPGALASYQSAISFMEPLVASTPEHVAYGVKMVELETKLGDIQGMEGFANLGDTAGALITYRKLEVLLDQLLSAHPDDTEIKSKAADAFAHLGALSDSAGDVDHAVNAGRRSIKLLDELLAADPNNSEYRFAQLASKAFLRYALVDSNQLAEAIENSKSTIAQLRAMQEADPKNVQIPRAIAVTYNALGRDQLTAGQVNDAIADHKVALQISEELLASSPSSESRKSDLAFTEARLGEAQAASGDYDGALESYRKALALRGPGQLTNSSNARERQNLSNLSTDIAKAIGATGNDKEAESYFNLSVSLAENLSAAAASNAKLRAELALRYADFGAFHLQRRDAKAAREYFARSLTLWEELKTSHHLFPVYANKPDELTSAVAQCDRALAATATR